MLEVAMGALGGWMTLEPEQMLTMTGSHELHTAMTERTRIPQQNTSTRSITEKQKIARCAPEKQAGNGGWLEVMTDAVTFILI